MSASSMNVKKHIFLYRGALDPDDCKLIIKNSENIDYDQHIWYGSDGQTENKIFDNPEPLVNYPEYPSHINDIIHSLMEDYAFETGERFNINAHVKLRVNKYGKDSIMDEHVDHIQSLFDGTSKGIPILSSIIGLNTDYEGGDIVFFHGVNQTRYRLETGDMIIFPSCFLYPHRVESITLGIRYTAVTWGF